MNLFVTDINIHRFKEKIEHETDPEKRRILEKLLASEQAKRLRLGEDSQR